MGFNTMTLGNKPLRVLVCGSREWIDRNTIGGAIYHVNSTCGISTLIHGDARGADKLAGSEAEEQCIQVESYPADWKKHGRTAGPIRNSKMLAEGKPDLVLAFTYDLSASRGTRDMVTKATAAGVRVIVLPVEKEELWPTFKSAASCARNLSSTPGERTTRNLLLAIRGHALARRYTST